VISTAIKVTQLATQNSISAAAAGDPIREPSAEFNAASIGMPKPAANIVIT
jgi:hypothetical protein